MELTGFQKRYRVRRAAAGSSSLEVTFPQEVVERKAREVGLSIDDFLKAYSAIADYDQDRVIYTLSLTPTE